VAHRWAAAVLLLASPLACPALADSADEARAINQQVMALIRTSKLDEAEALAQKGLLLCDDAGAVKVFCASQFNEFLGDIWSTQKNHASALPYYEAALRLREAGLGSGHPLTSRSLLHVGRTYFALQRAAEAESYLQRAAAGFGKQAPVTRELGLSFGYLRNIYLQTSRLEEAIVAGRRELAAYEAAGEKDGFTLSSARLGLSLAVSRQVAVLISKNNVSDAEPILLEAIRLIDPPAPGMEKIASTLQGQLGYVYEKQRRYAEAEPVMLRALEYRSRLAEPADPDMPVILSNLASLYANLQKPAETMNYALRSVARFDESKQESPALGFALFRLGVAQVQLGRLPEAQVALLRAKPLLDRFLPTADLTRVSVRNELAGLWKGQEKYREAEQELLSALDLEKELGNPANGWRAVLLASLGLNYRDLGRYAEAEHALSEALRLEEAAGEERSKFVPTRLVELAGVLRRENRFAEAEAALQRALALQPSDVDRASALNSLGVVYTTLDQQERAVTVLQEALAIRQKILPANNYFIAETIGNLATVEASQGRHAEAEAKLRHVLEIVDGLGLSRTSNAALYASMLSQALVSQGKLEEADGLIGRSLEIYSQRLGSGHPRFAGALKTRASIEALRGRDKDAETHYRQALAIDEAAIGPQSSEVAGDLMSLVPLLKRAGKQREAQANIDCALAIYVARFGADSPLTAPAIMASASIAYETGRYVLARQLADRARNLHELAVGPEHYSLGRSWIFAARLGIAEGKLDDATADLDRAAGITARTLPDGHAQNIEVLEARADVARALGKPADAEQHIRAALNVAERLFEPDHPTRQAVIDRLVGLLWMQGRFADAEQLRRDQLARAEQQRGPDHPSTAIAIRGLANLLGVSARLGEAITLYRRALAIDERSFGAPSDQAAWDHFVLGTLLRRIGQFEDARIEINLARNAWEGQGRLLAANAALEQLSALAIEQDSSAESVVFLERIVSINEQAFGPDSPVIVDTLARLGHFYLVAGRIDDAGKILARISGLIGEDPAEQSPGYLNVLQLRALLSAERGKFDEAAADLTRAIAVAAKYGGPQHNSVANNSFNLAAVYLRAGRFQDAIDYFVKALDIFKRESGDRASVVGYTLLGAARAYAGNGDEASSKALTAVAAEILGPTVAAQRPEPKWL
jgi:tetratricopeptide (TPR) repeat protein